MVTPSEALRITEQYSGVLLSIFKVFESVEPLLMGNFNFLKVKLEF